MTQNLPSSFTKHIFVILLFFQRQRATWSRASSKTLRLCTRRSWPGHTRRTLDPSTVSRTQQRRPFFTTTNGGCVLGFRFWFGPTRIPAVTFGALSIAEDYSGLSERAKRLNVDVSLRPPLSPSNPCVITCTAQHNREKGGSLAAFDITGIQWKLMFPLLFRRKFRTLVSFSGHFILFFSLFVCCCLFLPSNCYTIIVYQFNFILSLLCRWQ